MRVFITVLAKFICALALVTWTPTAMAVDFAVNVSRDAPNYYVGKSGFQGVIKTQLCFEFVFFDNATLRLTAGNTGTLIFSSGQQCQVMNVFDPATVATGNYAVLVNSDLDGYYEVTDGSLLIKALGFDFAFGSSATLALTSAINGLASGTITLANSSPRTLTNIYATRQTSTQNAANYQGLWWKAPASSESGWGINFAHQGDIIFATWFTYDATGKALWLSMTASKAAERTYTGTFYQTRGPAFSAVPFSPSAVTVTAVGSGTLTFSDANNGSFAYTVNGISQTKAITRQAFGTLPICTFGAQPNLALATNYQDLWWAAPGGIESGWGVNFTHQGDTIFATWFTYDVDGTPLWLSATAPKTAAGVYTGTLYRTTGPAFNAVPFLPANVGLTAVGTLTLSFANGNSATFAYTVNGVVQSKPITRQVFRAPGTVCQ